jgi:hypothetical protein
VNDRRVDLLGELPDGKSGSRRIAVPQRKGVHFADGRILGIGLRYGRLPRQVVLYVGEAPLQDRVEGPDVSVRFNIFDIRDLDGEQLLARVNMGIMLTLAKRRKWRRRSCSSRRRFCSAITKMHAK